MPRWMLAGLALLVACGPGGVEGPTTPDPMMRPPPPPVEQDDDGDGLEDAWETWAGDATLLDPTKADTDGDGILDADEDPDGDGLTNLEELSLDRLAPAPAGLPPHPFQRSLLVELDAMEGRRLDDAVLERAAAAYDDVDLGIHFFRDQEDLEATDFDGAFEQRWTIFDTNRPHFAGRSVENIRLDRMIHVVVAKQRTDIQGRGGEVVTHGDGDPEKTGVFVYYDTLEAIHPACGRPEGGPIVLEDALTATLVHEVGHALQLGHDTQADGGINFYNVMAVARSCDEALMRFEGIGNDDASLGATEALGEPRFSAAAVQLMEWDRVVSVDVAVLVGDTGREM